MKILRDAKVIHFSQLFDLVGLPLPPFGIFGEMPRKVIAIFGIAAATGLLIRTRQQESFKDTKNNQEHPSTVTRK